MSWYTGEEHFNRLFEEKDSFLASFTDPECGPCFRLKAQLKRLVKDIEISLVEINVREERDIFEAKYDYTGTPIVILVREKEVLKTWFGYHGRNRYRRDIEELL